MNQQTVYQTVSVQDEIRDGYFVYADSNFVKPTTGYFFTPEEFREVARIIWDESAITMGKTIKPAYPDFQTFYNQLTESK